jgi:hypothetical protein
LVQVALAELIAVGAAAVVSAANALPATRREAQVTTANSFMGSPEKYR